MIRTLKRIYAETGNVDYLKAAVKKRWITAEEYKEITGQDYKE